MSLFKPFVLKTRLAYKYAKRHLPPSLGFLSLHSRKPGVLPSFLIAGAMKSGTSSLYTYLSQHPGILPASRKEIHYLNNFPVSTKGNRYYRGNFPNQNEIDEVSQQLGYQAQTGEATPTMHLHAYPIGASSLIPDAKIIMVLRNPVDRAYSHYQHNIHTGRLSQKISFEQVLEIEQNQLLTDIERNETDPYSVGRLINLHSYIYRGYYFEQIQRWLRYFERAQLLIISFDSLANDAQETCNRVTGFIGLPEYEYEVSQVFNKGGYRDMIDAQTQSRLIEHFRSHNQRLFEFLGEDWGWST